MAPVLALMASITRLTMEALLLTVSLAGDGAEASIKFTGTTFDATASTLNGH